MPKIRTACFVTMFALFLCKLAPATEPETQLLAKELDPRHIEAGHQIPDEGYCDQPYVVITDDGNWLCVLTTGKGHEGQLGQHIVATISTDQGRTWGELIDIEPADGPEASWVVPLKVPSGRVYAFYSYNGDRIDTMPGSNRKIRADMLGWYCYKYSDDGGKTWSAQRHRIPLRVTAADRSNQWKGDVQVFWGIDKPKVSAAGVRFGFTKLGKYMLDNGEGWLLHSNNLFTETKPSKIHWQLLPDGDHGLRLPKFGSIQEEHNHVTIGGDDLFLVYRTKLGYPMQCYSDDGGHSWTEPTHMTYTPGGRRIKTPRACPKLFKCENGKYLFWFHNHSGKTFYGRNPVWISGGIVRDGKLHWSQPEILLYHNDSKARGMSYPDLVEQDGKYWVTETQKSIARIHKLDPALLNGLWNQGEETTVSRDGLVFDIDQGTIASGDAKRLPKSMELEGGLTIDTWLLLESIHAGQLLVDTRDDSGVGAKLSTVADGAVAIEICDGKTTDVWQSEPGTIVAGKRQHLVVVVDDGPKVISFVVDGQLLDGGEHRQFGWGRYNSRLRQPSGAAVHASKSVKHLRIYNRYLRTSEAVAHFHAGM